MTIHTEPKLVVYRESNGTWSAYVEGQSVYAAANTAKDAEYLVRRTWLEHCLVVAEVTQESTAKP